MIHFVPYSPLHRHFCLDVFDSNVPTFFTIEERELYAHYLDTFGHENYWCVFDENQFVGAGGYAVDEKGDARFVWGVIHSKYHRRGFGKALAIFRLKALAKREDVKRIGLDTSQHNPGFFSRFGFADESVRPDHYGPGLHSHEMKLCLTDEKRRSLMKEEI